MYNSVCYTKIFCIIENKVCQFFAVELVTLVKVRAEVVDQFFTDYGRQTPAR